MLPTFSKTAPRRTRGHWSAVHIDHLTPEAACTTRSGGRRPPTPAPPIPSLCLCVSVVPFGGGVLPVPCSLHRAGGGSVSSVGSVLPSAVICVICGFSSGRSGAPFLCASVVSSGGWADLASRNSHPGGRWILHRASGRLAGRVHLVSGWVAGWASERPPPPPTRQRFRDPSTPYGLERAASLLGDPLH